MSYAKGCLYCINNVSICPFRVILANSIPILPGDMTKKATSSFFFTLNQMQKITFFHYFFDFRFNFLIKFHFKLYK